MNKSQPTYTKEFKQQAVHLFETSGKNKTQIARDLGISDSALSKWCKELGVHSRHHVALVRAVESGHTSGHLYFDGREIPGDGFETVFTSDIPSSPQLLIGAASPIDLYRLLQPYQGMLAEVRLWNTALTAQEIAENMYLCLSGTESGLIGYWDFLHQNANDRSPAHNHGIVQGIVRFEGGQYLVEIMVGKYQAGGAPGAAWIGDHTFIAAFKGDSSEPYPRNVDVFFDASGGHEPSQPIDRYDHSRIPGLAGFSRIHQDGLLANTRKQASRSERLLAGSWANRASVSVNRHRAGQAR